MPLLVMFLLDTRTRCSVWPCSLLDTEWSHFQDATRAWLRLSSTSHGVPSNHEHGNHPTLRHTRLECCWVCCPGLHGHVRLVGQEALFAKCVCVCVCVLSSSSRLVLKHMRNGELSDERQLTVDLDVLHRDSHGAHSVCGFMFFLRLLCFLFSGWCSFTGLQVFCAC